MCALSYCDNNNRIYTAFEWTSRISLELLSRSSLKFALRKRLSNCVNRNEARNVTRAYSRVTTLSVATHNSALPERYRDFNHLVQYAESKWDLTDCSIFRFVRLSRVSAFRQFQSSTSAHPVEYAVENGRVFYRLDDSKNSTSQWLPGISRAYLRRNKSSAAFQRCATGRALTGGHGYYFRIPPSVVSLSFQPHWWYRS